jgi:hypothetical protein
VLFTIQKKDRIIAAAKKRHFARTHKCGIVEPNIVAEAIVLVTITVPLHRRDSMKL